MAGFPPPPAGRDHFSELLYLIKNTGKEQLRGGSRRTVYLITCLRYTRVYELILSACILP